MKKIFIKLISLMLVVITCFAFVGCHDFGAGGGEEGGGGTTPENIIAPSNLPDSVAASSSITFNYNTQARLQAPMNILQATEVVKRSSVAIAVRTPDIETAASGVIVDIDDGLNNQNVFYIITCNHLMYVNAEIMVLLPDEDFNYGTAKYTFSGVIGGTKASNANKKVTLVGGDKVSDIAVLKLDITGSDLTPSDIVKAKVIPEGYGVEYGEEVFAIGNPSGTLPGSLACGNIAYLYRKAYFEEIGNMTLFQINVATHPGSSGGGLYSMYGDLIGITNGGDREFPGTNFAIPYSIPTTTGIDNGFINIARQLIGTAKAVNFENYGYISGRKETIGYVVASSDLQGAKIEKVSAGSIAEQNGMQVGDLITGVVIYKNGDKNQGTSHAITSVTEFTAKMNAVKIGDTIVLTIARPSGSNGSDYSKTYTVELAINQYYFANTGVYPS